MRTIRIGSKGQDVQIFQAFLRGGQDDDSGVCLAAAQDCIIADGIFGPATDRAVKVWQARKGLTQDGIIGPATWAAAVADGLSQAAVPTTDVPDVVPNPDPSDVVVSPPTVDKATPSWPPRPDWAHPLVSQAQREAVLGVLTYVAAPTSGNEEAVRITNDFAKNIAKFLIPLLSKAPISMHKLAGPQFQAWFQAIEKHGLGDRVIGFAGCWVPRFVRGSRTSLSNHSWGSAIDISVPANKRGHQPALVGQHGCVREIVEFCADFGLFWGGWYSGKTPLDGMHIELFKVLTPAELAAAKAKHGVA